jgi:hypothetical protein
MWLMMRTARKGTCLLSLVCSSLFIPVMAQENPEMMDPEARAKAMGRDFSAQPAPPARVTHESALTTQAIQLLDFCNNPAVASDFVATRLEQFSKISGRQEDCTSLRDYWPKKGGLAPGSSAPLPPRPQ